MAVRFTELSVFACKTGKTQSIGVCCRGARRKKGKKKEMRFGFQLWKGEEEGEEEVEGAGGEDAPG